MRTRALLAGAASLVGGFTLAGGALGATTFTTPGFFTYTVSKSGIFDITAWGGQGGGWGGQGADIDGGWGAQIGGEVTLSAGETLLLVVGAAGVGPGDYGASGGGGSFVALGATPASSTPLVVAGGGGGAGSGRYSTPPGGAGQTGTSGGMSGGGIPGGAGGAPGRSDGPDGGGGGGGFFGPGAGYGPGYGASFAGLRPSSFPSYYGGGPVYYRRAAIG
ncbi:MAG: hypothetical protein ACREEX_05230, partial [Caulobacteraceae bacterium]